VSLRYPNPLPDHKPTARLVLDRNIERGAGQGERAADRQQVAFLKVEPRAARLGMFPVPAAIVSR